MKNTDEILKIIREYRGLDNREMCVGMMMLEAEHMITSKAFSLKDLEKYRKVLEKATKDFTKKLYPF